MSDYVLAIDQGTTGTTVLILDRKGAVQGRSYSEFRQYYPKPGWVEHDPLEIWEVSMKVVAAALENAGVKPEQVAAVGITNQRETTVVWDRKTGEPVHNAIVWQCRRTAPLCEQLKGEGKAGMVGEKTGLVIDAYFSGTKIKWILDNVAGAAQKAGAGELCFGTIDTWLIYKLSGGRAHVTDYTNASRTMLFNIESLEWDDELLSMLDVPRSMLPEVRPSSGEFARTDCEVLGEGIPIAGVAGDQQAALFGQGCFEPGLIKNTYGTGCFCLIFTGDESLRSRSGLVTTVSCGADGGPAYALEGSIFIAGAVVQWLRDELRIISSAEETEELARSVPDNGGVYFVPAFVGLGAPYWDPHARGAMLGLTRGAGRAHVVRAALESIAFQTRDMADAMREDLQQAGTGFGLKELRVDGGACMNNFLMQFQSDVLDLPVDRPEMIETTSLGSAYLAGLAVGFWPDSTALQGARRTERKFRPAMDAEDRERVYGGWLEAVRRVKSAPSTNEK
ncbi:MAG: glycerol kinase GlpK [bacterium]